MIDFGAYQDLSRMDKDALLALLAQLEAQISALDEAEPEDMESEAYELWGEEHEELEDQLDEIRDLLDDMNK